MSYRFVFVILTFIEIYNFQGNEEEIVSSSSSQNPIKRSVKTQTKSLDMKPSKEWIEKVALF